MFAPSFSHSSTMSMNQEPSMFSLPALNLTHRDTLISTDLVGGFSSVFDIWFRNA